MKSTAMRFFLLLVAVAFAEEAEEAKSVQDQVKDAMDNLSLATITDMLPDQATMEEYGLTKENAKTMFECVTTFLKKVGEDFSADATKAMDDYSKKFKDATDKGIFDTITENCKEKSLLEKIFYKMKNGEYTKKAKEYTDKAKKWASDKAATFGDKLKNFAGDKADKAKALYAKVFGDDGKIKYDGFKDLAKQVKFKADGTVDDKANQPEDVQLAIETDVIDVNDAETVTQVKAINEAAKLEASATTAQESSDKAAAADASPAFIAAAGVAFIALLL